MALGKGLYRKPYKTGHCVRLKPYTDKGLRKKNFAVNLPKRTLTELVLQKYAKILEISYFCGVLCVMHYHYKLMNENQLLSILMMQVKLEHIRWLIKNKVRK